MAVTRRRRRDEDDEPDEGSSRRATSADKYRDEDDEEDTPRASRRRERESTRDEDDDERPRRFRSRDADDDDADDEPRSRRRSRGDDEDDEERPRSRRRSRDDDADVDDDDQPRSRRRSSRDDEPRGRRRRARDDDEDDAEGGPDEDRAGFAGFRKARAASGLGGERFKVPEEAVLIKIMDDETVYNWNVHWVNRRPWVCIEKDCPLCDAGHTAQPVGLVNVVQINGKKPVVQQWEAGPQAVTALEKKGKSRSGPLTRHYYSIERYKEGGNGPWKLDLQVVRESEVVDDWKLEPLTDDDLDKLEKQCKGKEYVKYPTRKELREVAKTLDD